MKGVIRRRSVLLTRSKKFTKILNKIPDGEETIETKKFVDVDKMKQELEQLRFVLIFNF